MSGPSSCLSYRIVRAVDGLVSKLSTSVCSYLFAFLYAMSSESEVQHDRVFLWRLLEGTIEVKHRLAFLNHHGNHAKPHSLNHFWRHKLCNDLLLLHIKN